MKKLYLAIIILIVLIIAWLFVRFVLGGNEDDWIKNEKGVWIKHGNPTETPDYVKEQQESVSCALNLYLEKKNSEMNF